VRRRGGGAEKISFAIIYEIDGVEMGGISQNFSILHAMVKLEEDNDFDYFEDFREEKPAPQINYNYQSRRILVWVENEEIRQTVEETLAYLLPLATIRMVSNEEKAFEISEKEKCDTFVVDLTEENVSNSEFVKAANNNPEVMIIALDYSILNRENEQNEMYFDSIRKLFELTPPPNGQTEELE
jgi:CheY-like chemotaxis protein